MKQLTSIVDALRRESLLVQAPAQLPSITGLTDDTRQMKPGHLYVAIRGTQVDGHRFIAEAVRAGAAAVLVETAQNAGVPEIIVTDGRRAASVAARAWFGEPARRLTLVGVTGTNGKTTTTALARHLLNRDQTAGSIGTLGAFDGAGDPIESTAGALTTPGPVDLQATLAGMLERGVTQVVMEASSHSLDKGRLDDLTFAVGIFTNLSQDHLDYHRTMEEYLAAKLRLRGLLGNAGIEVINLDDTAWKGLLGQNGRRVTFGLSRSADLRAEDIQLDNAGSVFQLAGYWGQAPVRLPLLGEYNIANALGAAAAALALDLPFEEVVQRLRTSPQVPGRMELILEKPAVVLRDYAHTPDALERALAALRPLTPGRLIVVFGCGGDRDRGKRPLMGRIASELADLPIVTSDNPRTEDPVAIIDEIERGMARQHLRFTDRRQAIHAALTEGKPGDTILLAGKGHETYQVIGRDKLPFDEREIVREGRP